MLSVYRVSKKNATQRKYYIIYNLCARIKLKTVLERQDMYLSPQKIMIINLILFPISMVKFV